ncbi:MAG: nucleoside-diphosphate kinase [Candidatus Cloacimonadota bacterium]|nr:nucleoside-diphosphate kinase [Candidatus Cloacimonadota bacterium]
MKERSLLLIKPNANKKIGSILKMLEDNFFEIVQLKKFLMERELANQFYAIHKERPFFDELVTFMTSDDIIAVEVQKENAVTRLREIIGATNPAEAKAGTLRYLFAKNITENGVHGSDSIENAKKELSIIF